MPKQQKWVRKHRKISENGLNGLKIPFVQKSCFEIGKNPKFGLEGKFPEKQKCVP